jgi:hypothetical protein
MVAAHVLDFSTDPELAICSAFELYLLEGHIQAYSLDQISKHLLLQVLAES